MNWSIGELEPAQREPVSLDAARAHLRIDGDEQDALIESLLAAARHTVEKRYLLSLAPRRWRLKLDRFPNSARPIRLPIGPVLSVDRVAYLDTAGTETELTGYQVDLAAHPSVARLAPAAGETWPDTQSEAIAAVTIDLHAGFGTGEAGSLDQDLERALLLLAAHLYAFPEPVITGGAVPQVPMTAEYLLSPFRTEWNADPA